MSLKQNLSRTLITLGGGGFSMEPDNLLLDLAILQMAWKRGIQQPKILFIPTASGDSNDYIQRFYKAFQKFPVTASHLSLFKGKRPDIREFILEQDIIYVGGGNTRNMLLLWQAWGVDSALRQAYEQGKILAGISAGAICWFEEGLTDSFPGRVDRLDCLGWIKGSCTPHYDGEPERRPTFQNKIQQGLMSSGLAIDDSAMAIFTNEKLTNCFSSHPDKLAFEVEKNSQGKLVESALPTEYLGQWFGKNLHHLPLPFEQTREILRRASKKDAEEIHRSHMESIRTICSEKHTEEEIHGWAGRAFNPSRWHEAIDNHHVYVVEHNGVVEGHLYFAEKNHPETGEPSLYIYSLYLTKVLKGKGWGRKLMEVVVSFAREQKIKFIACESTLNAQKFYRSCGFKASGLQQKHLVNGSEVRCVPMIRNVAL